MEGGDRRGISEPAVASRATLKDGRSSGCSSSHRLCGARCANGSDTVRLFARMRSLEAEENAELRCSIHNFATGTCEWRSCW